MFFEGKKKGNTNKFEAVNQSMQSSGIWLENFFRARFVMYNCYRSSVGLRNLCKANC